MVYLQKYRRNKYGNKKCSFEGYIYDSRLEADYAQELSLRKKAGDILDWDRQFKVSIDINGYHICNYYVDFRVHEKDESFTLVELKGMETDVWKIKRKLLEAVWLPEHLDHQYEVIKQNSRLPKRKP
jgi:hypothetical protein